MPIVGNGNAYRKLNVPIIGPTQQLPSGGFNYINLLRLLNPVNWWRDTNPVSLARDLLAGLIGLTCAQVRAVCRYSKACDVLFACGDIVPILFARVTGRPFFVFLVSTSSYYEGRVKLPWLAQWSLRSRHCLSILTRDRYTAQDLQQRGFRHAYFLGYPIMDVLTPRNLPLREPPHLTFIALLPGSRLPEAEQNFGLLLGLCEAIVAYRPAQFHAALVPGFTPDRVRTLAQQHQWQVVSPGYLRKGSLQVRYHYDAFADILHQADLVVGMAGTAVEQAVGLGKPVVQIPGSGPQFTYLFAEAQMRLLGSSVITVGTRPAGRRTLLQAAQRIDQILNNPTFLQECKENGRERVGEPGGSVAIARHVLASLETLSKGTSVV